MAKLKVSEIFYSLQGEGLWTGVPSIFLRTYGCNFKCAGFNMPDGQLSTEPDEIAKDISNYKSYDELPLARTGCDSYAAWHPKFKKLSPMLSIDEVVKNIKKLLPNGSWVQPDGSDVHLVITGGEPLLGWQRSYPSLFDHEEMQDLRNVTFETNATQTLDETLANYISKKDIYVTWSCSPKLSVSGEKWDEAIRPDVVHSYNRLAYGNHGILYLKFVVSSSHDIMDVERAVAQYRQAGITCPVYVMPVGGTADTYMLNNKQVAELAMQKGWRYSPRLQVDLWKNAWGT